MDKATRPTIKYLVHSNKYGWVVRLGGWTGPVMSSHATKEEAVERARNGARGIDWAMDGASDEEIQVSL